MNLDRYLDLAADPARARLGLEALSETLPELEEPRILKAATVLSGASRFLAAYAARQPGLFLDAVADLATPVSLDRIQRATDDLLAPGTPREELMTRLRRLRYGTLMGIALRDLLGITDFETSARELSHLAEGLIDAGVRWARTAMTERFGAPEDDGFAVLGLGKLGGEELNFSSDVDLMYVYRPDGGETSGVLGGNGVRRGRVSVHEYYCRVAEEVTKILQTNTPDGFVARVDLRLRPEGDKGDIAVPLTYCELYYESYGREWERAALIRTRPVGGDPGLGREFLETIRPFVFRRLLDLGTIEELRAMKTRIDSTARANDIKRGPGGIREIEFFAQSFQLIFGGKKPELRTRATLDALRRISGSGLITTQDCDTLTEAYIFLRTLEHRIQMVQDLQTHRLPGGVAERTALARSMGAGTHEELTTRVDRVRRLVRSHYQALFEPAAPREDTEAGAETAAAILFDNDLTHNVAVEALQQLGFRNIERSYRDIMDLRETIRVNQTRGARRRLRKILPEFMARLLASADADRALGHLQEFIEAIGANESYLEILSEETPFSGDLVTIFAETEYLSSHLIRSPALVDALREMGVYGRRTLRNLVEDLRATVAYGADPVEAIRAFKTLEEIRLGILYVNAEISLSELHRGLTKTAEAILQVALERALEDSAMDAAGEFAVIGLGKLGGWEITYGSDLDIVFVTGEDSAGYAPVAEELIHILTSYTRTGVAYKVDTRLRPEGEAGPLVHSLTGHRRYYLEASALWERQALLRSRPVAGNRDLGADFFTISREVVAMAGDADPALEIRPMRERMERELSKENTKQVDLKFGPGSMSELEFTIQCLQLRHARKSPRVIVPNTPMALSRLRNLGYLEEDDVRSIREAYVLFRRVETALRLIGRECLPRAGDDAEAVVRNLWQISSLDQLLETIEKNRREVRRIWELVTGV